MYRSHGDPLLGLPTLTLAPALSSSPTGLFCQFAACQTLQGLWAAGLTMSERWMTPRCPSETGFWLILLGRDPWIPSGAFPFLLEMLLVSATPIPQLTCALGPAFVLAPSSSWTCM